jgi:hypothetical protein
VLRFNAGAIVLLPSVSATAALSHIPSLPALDVFHPSRYHCRIETAEQSWAVPISTLQVRHRADRSGYASVTIPAPEQYADALAALGTAEVIVDFEQGSISAELCRFSASYSRIDEGSTNATATLSGTMAASTRTPVEIALQDVTYLSTVDGNIRYRSAARGDVRPGDYVTYQGVRRLVTEATWAVGVGTSQMEVTT